jgi:hypothetical protein
MLLLSFCLLSKFKISVQNPDGLAFTLMANIRWVSFYSISMHSPPSPSLLSPSSPLQCNCTRVGPR